MVSFWNLKIARDAIMSIEIVRHGKPASWHAVHDGRLFGHDDDEVVVYGPRHI